MLKEKVRDYKDEISILKEILVNSKADITMLKADIKDLKSNEMAALSIYHKHTASLKPQIQNDSIKYENADKNNSQLSNEKENLSRFLNNPNRSVHSNHMELLDQSIDRKIRHLISLEDSQSKSAVGNQVV